MISRRTAVLVSLGLGCIAACAEDPVTQPKVAAPGHSLVPSLSWSWPGATVVVKPSTLKGACQTIAVPTACYSQYPKGWLFYNDETDAGDPTLGAFVTGPGTPPAGTGSAQITVSGTQRRNLATYEFAGTPLTDITALRFTTYNPSAGNGGSATRSGYLQFNVDFNGTDTWQSRLIYLPADNGTVTQDVWKEWDAISGGTAKWRYSGSNWPVTGEAGTTTKTWSQILSDYPGVRIRVTDAQMSIRVGEPYTDGYTEDIDSFVFGTAAGTTTYDFEPETPCTTVCYADAVNGNDTYGGDTPSSAKKTIQAALNQVSAGGAVHVLPGTYSESAPGSTPTTIAGTYQFGLFFGSAKPGITLMGVTAGDVPITSAGATVATINTNATNDFGTDGIFVEAANTTIRGVTIGPNAGGDNKTIEVVANNFTLQYVTTAIPGTTVIPGGGSIYIDDFSAGGTVVQSYHILDNAFTDGTSVDISSGAGNTGPVSGREILRNTFDLNGYTWPGVSFNGSGTPVPWFTNPVGAATIQGNTFRNGALQYIRTRGILSGTQPDWQSYWNGNTFDKATVTLTNEATFAVRPYSYVGSYGTFSPVRRIGTTIQAQVDTSDAGNTVLVKGGTYREDVRLNKNGLTLRGAGMDLTTIVGPMTGAGTTLEIPASSVTVDGVTITRDGNNTADWTTTVKNQGVAIYGSDNTLQNSRITANRNGVFIYGGLNNALRNNTIDFNRTGIHLVNDVSGLVVRNNFITNNWTIGILFRDESSPNPTGTVTITDNNISGNWYSQIEARSQFSNPQLNASGNWLGTVSPTVLVAPNSSEPGYAGQIPVAFGGSAVPPSSAPTVVYNGINATNPVIFSPWLCSGVDASPAIGFQPSVAACTFGSFLSPLPKSTLAKAGSSIPVKFTILGVTDGSLANNQQVRAVLSGPGTAGPIVVTAFCSWNAAGQNFQCNLATPKGLKTGTTNPYYIAAQWTGGSTYGGPVTWVNVPGAGNPEAIYFK